MQLAKDRHRGDVAESPDMRHLSRARVKRRIGAGEEIRVNTPGRLTCSQPTGPRHDRRHPTAR